MRALGEERLHRRRSPRRARPRHGRVRAPDGRPLSPDLLALSRLATTTNATTTTIIITPPSIIISSMCANLSRHV